MKSHATVTWITMVPQEGEFTENLPPGSSDHGPDLLWNKARLDELPLSSQ